MTWHCRSCAERLDGASVLCQGALLVCSGCGVDCRCPPEGAIAIDPVQLLDDDQHEGRDRVSDQVRFQLYPLPWTNGQTIGDLLDKRCASTRGLSRCTRDLAHHGPHAAGEVQWGGG